MKTLAKWIKKKLDEAFTPYLFTEKRVTKMFAIVIVIMILVLLIVNIKLVISGK